MDQKGITLQQQIMDQLDNGGVLGLGGAEKYWVAI